MRLSRETTAARIRRAAVSVLAVVGTVSATAVVPVAMNKMTQANRIRTGPGASTTVAAGGESVLPPPPDGPPNDAASDPAPDTQDETRPTPVPAPREDAPFTIDLPEGWSGGEAFEAAEDAARSFRYADESGRAFVVNLDPEGSGFSADLVWTYEVLADRFRIIDTRRCREGEAMCDAGNGALLGFAIWSEGGSATVAGHAYYFRFEDPATETGDTGIFRRILQSIRVVR